MKILIEGIDRVGKTTLANKLSESFNIPVFHDVNVFPFEREICIEKMWTLLEAIKSFSVQDLIIDRFHASEYAYGLNRGVTANTDFLFQLDEIINQMEFKVIHVKPTDIKKSSEKHGWDLTNHEKAFQDFWLVSKNKPYFVDYNDIMLRYDQILEVLK